MSCHTPFGSFEGWKGDGVVQYRGIKYAFLRDQMAVPQLVTEYGSERVDATEFGYVGFCFSPFFSISSFL